MDLSKATLGEMTDLTGIGDQRAKAIMDAHSKKDGPLTEEELRLVPGIPSTVWDHLLETNQIGCERMAMFAENIDAVATGATFQLTVQQEFASIRAELAEWRAEAAATNAMLKESRTLYAEAKQDLSTQGTRIVKAVLESDAEIREATNRAISESRQRLCERLNIDGGLTDKSETDNISVDRKLEDHAAQTAPPVGDDKYTADIQSRIKLVAPEGKYKPHSQQPPAMRHTPNPRVSTPVQRIGPGSHPWLEPTPPASGRSVYSSAFGRHIPKAPDFNGDVSWTPYIMQFEEVCVDHGMDDNGKRIRLVNALKGKALTFYGTLSSCSRGDYELLKSKLESRFGERDTPQMARRLLQALSQEADETIEEFAEKIQRLAHRGNPGVPSLYVERQAIDAFLRGCRERQAVKSMMDSTIGREIETLDEVILWVRASVQNAAVLGSRAQVRQVTFSDAEEGQGSPSQCTENNLKTVMEAGLRDINKTLVTLLSPLVNLRPNGSTGPGLRLTPPASPQRRYSGSPARGRSSSPVRCYNCNEHGHYQRECPRERRTLGTPPKEHRVTSSPSTETSSCFPMMENGMERPAADGTLH